MTMTNATTNPATHHEAAQLLDDQRPAGATPRTCRLTLRINNTDYTLRKLKGGVRGWLLKGVGTTGEPETFEVIKDQWGEVGCQCGGDSHRSCSHRDALIACYLIAPAYRAKDKRKDFHEAVL